MNKNKDSWSGQKVWEFATSPITIPEGGVIARSTVEIKIEKFKKNCKNMVILLILPFVFPINKIDDEISNLLEEFKGQYSNVNIKYYDCFDTDSLISNARRLGLDLDLISYIQEVRKNSLGIKL
jgi:hypothetical protein